jgi:hypothetical protein
MTADRTSAIQALLTQAAEAHHVHERDQLGGIYDEAWPQWYAAWAFDHGIAQHLPPDMTVDVLADAFGSSWEDIQRADPERSEGWPTHMARRLVAEG